MASTPAQTRILLIRHGESEGNRSETFGGHGPTPLTDLGRRQAAATADRVAREFHPTVVFSSDLPRAEQTAEPLAERTGLPLQTTPDLRERSIGRLVGVSFRDARTRFPEDWDALLSTDPDARPGGGESLRDVYGRMSGRLDQFTSEHQGARIAVFSHGMAIYQAFLHVCGIDPYAPQRRVFVRVGNCSLTEAVYLHDHQVWRLESLNDRAHLSAL